MTPTRRGKLGKLPLGRRSVTQRCPRMYGGAPCYTAAGSPGQDRGGQQLRARTVQYKKKGGPYSSHGQGPASVEEAPASSQGQEPTAIRVGPGAVTGRDRPS
jgi:hypothetical protein